jgi:hypothetical protein
VQEEAERVDEEDWLLQDVIFVEDSRNVPVGKVLKVSFHLRMRNKTLGTILYGLLQNVIFVEDSTNIPAIRSLLVNARCCKYLIFVEDSRNVPVSKFLKVIVACLTEHAQ